RGPYGFPALTGRRDQHRGGAVGRRVPDHHRAGPAIAMELRGAVAVVTGASSGIGWATASALAREGATVVAAARREDRLRELVDGITARGGTASVELCDVSDRS